MANISVVEDTLVNLVSGILYPNGTSNPSIVASVRNIYIYAGWLIPESFQSNMQNNSDAHVTIFPTNMGRNTTRFRQEWIENTINPPTLTATLSGDQVTINGTVTIPQAVMIIVNNIGYAYQVLSTDTLDTIAASLSALIPNSSSLFNVITINGAFSIIPRITQSGIASKEVKRQEVLFNVITWSKSRDTRTDVSNPIEIGLGKLSRFLLPQDNYWAPILYNGIKDHEELQKSIPIYRRDLIFKIEYPTIIEMNTSTITDEISNIEITNELT